MMEPIRYRRTAFALLAESSGAAACCLALVTLLGAEPGGLGVRGLLLGAAAITLCGTFAIATWSARGVVVRRNRVDTMWGGFSTASPPEVRRFVVLGVQFVGIRDTRGRIHWMSERLVVGRQGWNLIQAGELIPIDVALARLADSAGSTDDQRSYHPRSRGGGSTATDPGAAA